MSETSQAKSVALVTGAGKATGIGLEVCRQLAGRGLAVILTSRSAEQAEQLAAALRTEGHDVVGHGLDVTDDNSVDTCRAFVERRFGRLDVLVNNAAASGAWGETVADADLSRTAIVLAVIFEGAWRVTRAFLPLLRRSPAGRIVNVSSGAGSHGDPVFGLTSGNSMGPSYSAAKAALNALTAVLAREEAGGPLRVNAVCPGFTATFPGGAEMGARPVAEGASGIVWAATLPPDGPTGGFFRDGLALPW